MVVKDGDGVLATAAKLRDALRDAGVRVALDDRVDTAVRAPGGRRRAEGLSRSASRSAPATWPPATSCWSAGFDGSKTPTPVTEAVPRVIAALEADQQALYDEALARRESHTVDVDDARRRDRGDRRPAGPACRGRRSASRARRRRTPTASPCAAWSAPTASVPDSDDEPDLIAYLARAY